MFKKITLCFTLLAFFCLNAKATTYYLKNNNPTQNWNDPCNWYTDPLDISGSDCDGVPGLLDHVIINGHSFIQLQAHTTISSLHMDNGYGWISGNYNLYITNDAHVESMAIQNNGELHVFGNLYLKDGGLGGTDTAFVHGTTYFDGTTITTKTLVLNGGGEWRTYHINLKSNGKLVVPSGELLTMTHQNASGSMFHTSGGYFHNYGTFQKNSSKNLTLTAFMVSDGGAFYFLDGLTTISNNMTCTNTEVNIANHAVVDFNNGTRSWTGSTFNSEGTVLMKGGNTFQADCSASFDTLQICGSGGATFNISMSIPNLVMNGGGVYFNEDISITHSFWWKSGHVYGGSTVTCHPQANLVEDGGSASYTSCKIDFLGGAEWKSGNYVLTAGAELNFPYGADFLINFNSAGSIALSSSAAPLGAINLSLESILTKTGSGVATLNVVFNSTGSDVLVYGGGLNLYRGTHTDSYFEINSGLVVQCTQNGNYFNNCNITGTGILRETNFHSNLQSGTTLDCHLEITGGTLTVSSNITPASLKLSGGSLIGTGNITCTGNFNWSGATTLGGNSILEVLGTTTVSGGAKTFYSKELKVTGGGNWTATGNTAFHSAAKFRIPSGSIFTFAHTANMAFVPSTNPDGQLLIEGTLVKTTTFIIDLTGEILVNTGRIEGIGKMDTYNNAFVQNNDGAISPGDSIGTLTWGGHFKNAATGNLIFDFAKDPNSGVISFDQMVFQNNLTLGGALTVVGAEPCWENGTWDIISWTGTRTGSFDTIILPEHYSLVIDDVAKKIRISHNNGCQEMSRPNDDQKTAAADLNERETPSNSVVQSIDLQVFPVPASDVLHVRFAAQPDISTNITLTNSAGQQVYAESVKTDDSNQWAIPLHELPNGLYFLTLQIGTERSVRKIMVERG